MSFWKHTPPEFDEAGFRRFLEVVLTDIMGMIMADATRLTAAINAQKELVAGINSKVDSQGARITELEAEVAAGGGVDQASLDALAATVEANNDALKTTAS